MASEFPHLQVECGKDGTARADFDGTIYGSEYLSLVKGQSLILLRCDSHDGGWAFGVSGEPGGQRGWFPPSYWKPAAPASPPRPPAPQLAPWQQGMLDDFQGTVQMFIAESGLEDWIGEALELLSEKQKRSVIGPRLRCLAITSSKETVVLSRIRDVASLPQRLAIFGRINNLDSQLVDAIGSQEPAVQEEVMQWPKYCKLVRVVHPNAVVYRRLSDAQKKHCSIEAGACINQSAHAAASSNATHVNPQEHKQLQYRPPQEIVEELTLELLDALRRARRAEEDLAKLRSEVDELRRAKKHDSEGTVHPNAVPMPAMAA
eukprot:TRINITY_DN103885_c0_g1_i1.p1 TRINITY_DN103885_c0_g1~~TRINITY_DN103885_c0_g1_i1.p1  ORF type:complete len:328 (-),score=51.15 TRINITY_DN103885_c0_g1_i1:149-1102(-)